MNDLQIFSYQSHEVRTVEMNGEPWFVLKDVCTVLGLTTPARVAERLDADEVSQTHLIDSMGREQSTYIISESGLYSVILRSDKPEAKPFRKWVTSEVLPQIRKTGSYSIVQADPNLPPELALANQTLAAVNKIYRMQLSQGERLDKLEATKTLDHSQQLAIEEAKSQRVVKLLGGKTSPAYREMSRRVFMACGHDLKLLFDVSSYRDIPIVRFDDAKAYISAWMPKPDMLNEIQQTNGQTSLFDRNCAPAGRLREGGQTAQ